MNKYKHIINLIESRLETISQFNPSSYSLLQQAERYSLLAGGKHLRALILMQTASLGNVDFNNSVDYACALEMVHTYSLIHDDLPEMDNDDMRRGVATCHKKFGQAIALLAGDALLTKAFWLMANNNDFDYKTRIEAINILANACGENGMLAGQTIDKLSENKTIDYSQLLELHSRKTGDMFLAAVKIGAVLGNLDSQLSEKLEKYMSLLGIAFQIKDDILDVTSTSEVLGKNINSDATSDKSTFVSMFGLEKSNELLQENIMQAITLAKEFKNEFFLDLASFFENRVM